MKGSTIQSHVILEKAQVVYGFGNGKSEVSACQTGTKDTDKLSGWSAAFVVYIGEFNSCLL